MIGVNLTKGFLLYDSLIPPLIELDKGIPCISCSAKVAKGTSSNSIKHMGPLDFALKESRLNPGHLLNMDLSSSWLVLIGKLPTYNVLQGGF